MTDEELEKEAEERANKFIEINFNEPDNYGSEKEVGHFSYYTGYLAGAETREKRIEELDKENGKLEGKLSDLQSEYVELENFHNNEVNGLNTQLGKAKDLLLRFMDLKNKPCAVGHSINMLLYENICAEVEQLLKE